LAEKDNIVLEEIINKCTACVSLHSCRIFLACILVLTRVLHVYSEDVVVDIDACNACDCDVMCRMQPEDVQRVV